MSYYIRNVYPNRNYYEQGSTIISPTITSFNIEQLPTAWIVKGEVSIYSNAYLPSYSYYLDIDSNIFKLDNINLIYNRNVNSQNCYNFSISAYRTDIFKFKVFVSLVNSSIINENLFNFPINFFINIGFNQAVLNEFKIETNEDIRNKFVNQINHFSYNKNYIYSNTFILNHNQQEIIKSLDQNDIVKITTHKIDDNTLFNKILVIQNLNSFQEVYIKEVEIEISYLINGESHLKTIKEVLKDIKIEDQYELIFNKQLAFDYYTNTLKETTSRSFNGFFIPKQANAFISIKIILAIDNIIKKINYSHHLKYTKDLINLASEKMFVLKDSTIFKLYQEFYEK